MRNIIFKITRENELRIIKDFLRNFGVSSALLKKLKCSECGILVNGKHARAIDLLHTGDLLEINIEQGGDAPSPMECGALPDVVYEDEDIIAFNKPPFMPVHESRNHRGDALSNAYASLCGNQCGSFRAVYRLDRDTSGIVVAAKNELAASKLAGKIKKDYYAVVKGSLACNGGIIDAPIARKEQSIIERCVSQSGERAVTRWETVLSENGLTLVKLNLETGRTHQIRVHFSFLGMPLAGDTLYGGNLNLINRQALHCKSVSFFHPVSGNEIKLDCAFPQDFKPLINLKRIKGSRLYENYTELSDRP